MQHRNHLINDGETIRRHLQPGIKGVDQLPADVFSRMLQQVVVWSHQDPLILG